ncbi:MAG TPA: PIG-L deacetylase family protein [Chloroflexia bacterium]|nr:PIG-L deacetylase family protein [Chloroflexia bacterium]
MFNLNFSSPERSIQKVLCLGAHCDDIEIGCGGTVMQLAKANPQATFYWVVFSSNSLRAAEGLASAEAFLREAPLKNILIKDFRDGFFPFNGEKLKEAFEALKGEVSPDLIFTHYLQDRHQDHRVVSELTWNTFRNHLILEYEIPKYDGDLGQPNCYVPLAKATCEAKVTYLMDYFLSQRERSWFTEDTFLSLMRLRGLESNAPAKYAEAFHLRKMVISA